MWKSSASIKNLVKRAKIIKEIRKFFENRGFLEVDTPILSHASSTNINLSNFKTYFFKSNLKKIPLYLITSPEFHMKRLLTHNIGPIFQISHSFRNGEIGKYHNPEFTILEWYRPLFNIYQMMQEVQEFVQTMINCKKSEILSYEEVFIRYLKISPFSVKKSTLNKIAKKFNFHKQYPLKKDILLQLLFSFFIQPKIGKRKLTFIYHFPTSQAEMARKNDQNNKIAERFELYFEGIELANGSQELTDFKEQVNRFNRENNLRKSLKIKKGIIDKRLLSALKYKMPECSGVALGIDRLIMLILKLKSIKKAMSFSIERA